MDAILDVRARLKELDMKPAALARKIGVTRACVHGILYRTDRASPEVASAISKALFSGEADQNRVLAGLVTMKKKRKA